MRVLFLGRHDWANLSHRVARGLRAVGHEARVVVLAPHPFGYPEDWVLARESASAGEWREFGASADWLVSTGDGDYVAFGALAGWVARVGQRRATVHVGSRYRALHEHYDVVDARFARRFVGGDLYRFARADPRAVPFFCPPGETVVERVAPVGERVRVGHSPSNRRRKGTDVVLPVLDRLRGRIEYDLIEAVSYPAAVRRRAACHVFVDQLAPAVGGFGASAVEALAAGCAVLADVRHVCPEVDRFYERPPILDVRDADELYAELDRLVGDRAGLDRLRARSVEWARRWATAEAVGRYWISHLGD